MYMDQTQGLQSEHPLHDNLFRDPFRLIAMDVGSMAGAWGLNQLGHARHGKKAAMHRRLASELSEDLRIQSRMIIDPDFSVVETNRKISYERAQFRNRVERARDYTRAGKSLRRFGRAFGLIGIAQLAFEGASALIGMGESFSVGKQEAEAARYRRMYDQDTYYDTRAAYTQRQRALQVIHNSRLSLKPMLGAEANYLHF